MTVRTDADEEWKIEPASHKRGWWAAGYVYQGDSGTHQGQFVPVHHFPDPAAARAFIDAIKSGLSRLESRELAARA